MLYHLSPPITPHAITAAANKPYKHSGFMFILLFFIRAQPNIVYFNVGAVVPEQ